MVEKKQKGRQFALPYTGVIVECAQGTYVMTGLMFCHIAKINMIKDEH